MPTSLMAHYTVRPNQTLPEIVALACPHLSVESVRSHAKNAGLFEVRDPYLLRTGDKIWIPEEPLTLRWCKVGTDEVHRFVRGGAMRKLKFFLSFPDGSIAANEDYELEIDGIVSRGTTNDEGMLETDVPITATKGEVKIDHFRQALLIGGLEPLTTLKGVQGRLANLGYNPGPVDGIVGPKTTAAIVAFQYANELEVDGVVGPKTRAVLEDRYGL
jgi:N-acetylmuramoyl-L-alanine amidase